MSARHVRSHLGERVLDELRAHLAQGRQLGAQTGEDGRPPLVHVQRWRFTAQTLLRRALIDEHPCVVAFDRHCYRGVLDANRFRKAVELFATAVDAAVDHGLAFRYGFIRSLLESALLAPEEDASFVVQAALWHVIGLLGSLDGTRGPGEHPSHAVLCNRLLERMVLDADLAALLLSTDPSELRRAAEILLEGLAAVDQGD